MNVYVLKIYCNSDDFAVYSSLSKARKALLYELEGYENLTVVQIGRNLYANSDNCEVGCVTRESIT